MRHSRGKRVCNGTEVPGIKECFLNVTWDLVGLGAAGDGPGVVDGVCIPNNSRERQHQRNLVEETLDSLKGVRVNKGDLVLMTGHGYGKIKAALSLRARTNRVCGSHP